VIFAAIDEQNVGDVSETQLSERQRKMIELLKKSPTMSGRQMSEILSVSQRTIERELSRLKGRGLLRHKGKDNAGAWEVLSAAQSPSPAI